MENSGFFGNMKLSCRISDLNVKISLRNLNFGSQSQRQNGSNFEFSPEFQRKAMGARVNNLTVDGTKLPYF